MEFLNNIIDQALRSFQKIEVVHLDEHLLFLNWLTLYRLLSRIVSRRSSQTFLILLDVVVGTFVALLNVSTEIDSQRNGRVLRQILREG